MRSPDVLINVRIQQGEMWHVWRVILATDGFALLASIHGSLSFQAEQVDALVIYAAIVWCTKTDLVGLQVDKPCVATTSITDCSDGGIHEVKNA